MIILYIYIITVILSFTIYDLNDAKNKKTAIFLLLTPCINILLMMMIIFIEFQEGEKDFLKGYKVIRKNINRKKYRKRMMDVDPYGEENWDE